MLSSLFFNYKDYTIDSFQLDNLLRGGVPFKLYLQDELAPEGNSEELINAILSKGEFCQKAADKVLSSDIDKAQPIIFICSSGRKSKKSVKLTAKDGFKNVYFLEGGFKSLSAKEE